MAGRFNFLNSFHGAIMQSRLETEHVPNLLGVVLMNANYLQAEMELFIKLSRAKRDCFQ
jgi:hypothetical protein